MGRRDEPHRTAYAPRMHEPEEQARREQFSRRPERAERAERIERPAPYQRPERKVEERSAAPERRIPKPPKSPAIPAATVPTDPSKPLTRAQRRALQFGHTLDEQGKIVATKGREESGSKPVKPGVPVSEDGEEEVVLRMPRRPAPRKVERKVSDRRR